MRAGASGYVLKGAEQAEILRAIRAVANGEVIFGPGIARRVMGLFPSRHAGGVAVEVNIKPAGFAPRPRG